MTNEEFREVALAFDGAEERPHFDRQAFKIAGKRIFATLHAPSRSANIKLPANEQSVFCQFGNAIYPVDNKWGQQGWTTFELKSVPSDVVMNALEIAHAAAAK